MRRTITALVLVAGMVQPVSAAPATVVYWASIATGCTPDSVSIQNDRYQSPTDNSLAPKPAVVDPIALICGVSPNPQAVLPNTISLTYLDATGTATTALVQASLIRVNRDNGARSVIVTVASNSSSGTSARKQASSFSSSLNFEAFYYYVRIEMDRAAANQVIRSIGVALEKPAV